MAGNAVDCMNFACLTWERGLFCALRSRFPASERKYSGGVAQLGERVNGIHEVRGSIPLASIRVGGGAAECRAKPLRRAGGAPRLRARSVAGIAQLVEHNLAKVGVAGSSPVSRSESIRSRDQRRVVEQSGSSPGS